MVDRSLNYGRHHIADFLRGSKPARLIVDLGAGHGTDLALARTNQPQSALAAIECWPPYVEEMTQQGIAVHSLNIEKDQLPFGNGSVDIVIANQILEHTKEIFWIFHEVSRVLSEGGTFIVGVPNLASLHNRLLLLMGRKPSPIKSASAHVRGFTKRDLIHFVDSCFPGGYRLAGFGGGNFYPFPASLAKPLSAMMPNLSWGIFLMFVKDSAYKNEFVDFPVVNKLETNFYLG